MNEITAKNVAAERDLLLAVYQAFVGAKWIRFSPSCIRRSNGQTGWKVDGCTAMRLCVPIGSASGACSTRMLNPFALNLMVLDG
jgi:hypothetical protein